MLFKSLETERLILKNIDENDREFIFSQFSDDDVNEFLFDAEPLIDIKGADEIIEFYIQPEPTIKHRWVIKRKVDNMTIGTCSFDVCYNNFTLYYMRSHFYFLLYFSCFFAHR